MDNFGSFNISEIRDLIDKSLILNLAKDSSTFTTRDLVVTEIFANEMIVDPDEAWKEFFSKYPGKLIVNNVSFAAKGLTLTEETRLEEKYKEIVGNNKYEHNNIISLLEKWKNSNGGFATMKIDKFIIGEYWKEIETERDSHVGPALF